MSTTSNTGPVYVLDTPTITSPVSGAIISGTSILLTASSFNYSPNDGTVNLASTSWYLYSDSALQNLVASDLNDTVNLTSYTFNNLTPGQTYYATVQYTTDLGIGNDPATSNAVSFTMAAAAPVIPVVTFDGRFSTLPLLNVLTGNEQVPIIKNNQNLTMLVSSMGAAGSETGPSLHLAGSPYIYQNGTNVYTITDYKLNETYAVSVSVGSVTISGDQISVTAPNATGPLVLTVNNKPYSLTVIAIPVSTPFIISPVNGAANQSLSVTFTSSAFSTPVTGPTQVSSSWQLATDSAFTNIFSQSLNSAINLTSWTVSGLALATTYYVRVQYTSSNGQVSNWSGAYSFTTTASNIATAVTAKITSGVNGGSFGYSVAISTDGTIVCVGAYSENSSAGAAYIYQNISGTWTQIVRLANSAGVSGDQFGYSVALNSTGTIAAIGNPFSNSHAGSVFIFANVAGTWTQTSVISSGVASGSFGITVSLSSDGSIVAIGAYSENSNTGAAYIYQNVSGTWTQIVRLSSAVANSNFGVSVSLSSNGTIAVIGANNNNSAMGIAYIYQNVSGTWTLITSLSPGIASSRFGSYVSINSTGTIVAIGAYAENSNLGAVYIYQNVSGTWTQMAYITNNGTGNYFGISVVLNADGTVVAIGCLGANAGAGGVYIFQNVSGTWTQVALLINSTGANGDSFGASVAIDSLADAVAVGAYVESSYIGAVYIAT